MGRYLPNLWLPIVLFVMLHLATPAGAADFKCPAKPFGASDGAVGDLSAAQIRQEIDCIVDILRNVHPNLYTYTPKKTLEALARELKSAPPAGRSAADIQLHYTKLISAVCDEHTAIRLPGTDDPFGAIPQSGFGVPLFVVGDDLLAALPRETEERTNGPGLPILKIRSINGRSAIEIRDFLRSQTVVDACATTRHLGLPGLGSQILLTRYFAPETAYEIIAEDERGRTHRYTMGREAIPIIALRLAAIEWGTRSFPFETRGFREVLALGGWRYLYNEAADLGYLHAGHFTEISEGDIRRIMRRILAENPGRLIVDLSNNHGGRLSTSMLMNSFLISRAHRPADFFISKRYTVYRPKDMVWDRDEKAERSLLRQFKRAPRRRGLRKLRFRTESFGNPHYRGRLFVLVSHATGSAAVASAYVLKKYRRDTTVLGTRTHGGGRWGCISPSGHYVLPHSRLRLYVPNACHERTGELAKRFETAIVPDVIFEPEIRRLMDFGSDLMGFAIRSAIAKGAE